MKTQSQSAEETVQSGNDKVLVLNRSRWSIAVDEAIKEAKNKLSKAASAANTDSKKCHPAKGRR